MKGKIAELMAMVGLLGATAERQREDNVMELTPGTKLYQMPPMHVMKYGGNPEFYPRRKKFKGFMREQHLGRRRSRFYFNKNK